MSRLRGLGERCKLSERDPGAVLIINVFSSALSLEGIHL